MLIIRIIFFSLLLLVQNAYADIPSEYEPLVVSPPFNFSERLVDLTPAFEKAKLLKKPMFVYLGAADCPPCKDYTNFLNKNKDEMKPALSKYVIVDIRTWLRGAKLIFQVNDKKYTFDEFKAQVGDSNNTLSYPYWWLLNTEMKQIKQLPRGSSNFTNVENHIRLITTN